MRFPGAFWTFAILVSVVSEVHAIGLRSTTSSSSRRALEQSNDASATGSSNQNRRSLWSRSRDLLTLYNRSFQQLITERHAFAPTEFSVSPDNPDPFEDTDPPTAAPTGIPTAAPVVSPAPPTDGTSVPTSAPVTSAPTPTEPIGTGAPTPLGGGGGPGNGDETVEQFLTRTVTDDGALQEDGTPQFLALQDILDNFPTLDPGNGDEEQTQITQLYGVGTIFYATNGTNWANRNSWATSDPPCTWKGIFCDDSDEIKLLDLRTNDMFGQLPSEVRALTNLGTFMV